MRGLRRGYFRVVNGKPVFVRPGFSGGRVGLNFFKKRGDASMEQMTLEGIKQEFATSPGFEEVAQLDGAYVAFRKVVRSLLLEEESQQKSTEVIEASIADGWEEFTQKALKIFHLSLEGLKVEEPCESQSSEMSVDFQLRAEFARMKEEQETAKRILRLERYADRLLEQHVLTPVERKSLLFCAEIGDDVIAAFSQFSESQGLSLADYLNHVEFCLGWREKSGASGVWAFFSQMAEEPIDVTTSGNEASLFVQEYRSRNGYE